MYTTTQAQICDGPLTVEIAGSQSENPLEITEDEVIQPNCVGPTGSIAITVSGGNPDYSVSWTKDDVYLTDTEDLTDVGAGEYAVEVTDASGCTATLGPWTLEEPSGMEVTVLTENPTCNVEGAEGDGVISLEVTGGTGTYTYAWSTSDGGGIIDGAEMQSALTGGTYSVTITDEAGCEVTEEITLTSPTLFEASLATVDPDCNATNGDENGSITVTVTGGTGVYTFAWSTSDGSGLVDEEQNQTTLTAGTYTVVITDESDCSITLEATLEGAEPMAIVETVTAPTCHEDNGAGNGAIAVEISGGSGTYTYTWTTEGGSGLVDGEQNQTGLTAGLYTVEVSDENGCSTWKDITLEGPEAIVAEAVAESPGCFGMSDGTITVSSITGGAGSAMSDYTLTWTTTDGSGLTAGATTQTGLSVGTYTLEVADANGCTASYEYEITEPSEISVEVAEISQLSCHHDSGPADGAISLDVSGGSGNYTFVWSTTDGSGLVEGEQDQSGLSAGTYTVLVTDGSGCETEEEFILVEPAVVAIGHTVIPPDCADDNGSIWTAISGGQGSAPTDYTYTWSTENGSGLTDGTIHQQSVGPGTYYLTVADANGCTNSAEFEVESPSTIEASAAVTSEILCNGETGGITVTASGGSGTLEYSIDDSDFQTSPVFGLLSAGEYTITVQDENGCTEEIDVVVEEPAQLTAGTCTEVQDLCQVSEGEIKVQVQGGTAPYQVTWSSTNGGTLNEPSGQVIDADGGSFTFTGAEGGKAYSFIITDDNGCLIP